MHVLIVEDHPVFREILSRIIAELFPGAKTHCAADGATALGLLQAWSFTHLLLDLQLPDIDGFRVAHAALSTAPAIRIIALTSHCDAYTVFRAEKLHVRGFVDKQVSTTRDFHQALAGAEAELAYFSPSFLLQKSRRLMNPVSFDKILSPRELEMLALIAVPFSDAEIAVELGLSPATVEKHRFNILRKVGLQTTTELMRYARNHGITHFHTPARLHESRIRLEGPLAAGTARPADLRAPTHSLGECGGLQTDIRSA